MKVDYLRKRVGKKVGRSEPSMVMIVSVGSVDRVIRGLDLISGKGISTSMGV